MAVVHFPRQFMPYTDQHKTHVAEGVCVNDVLGNLTTRFPALIGPVFSEDLHPLPFVGLFVNGMPVMSEQDRGRPLDSNAQLILINAVAGG
ncbi:MoaD/ThiS family protein [Pseudomonas sp. MWU15-20650]|uniref:MoaD/ThiS family protein n=1 Tax=Pseudomonas sp. MWU15-20650 TaxID=2933107 RepID=UPI002010044E|nr:MoaD/ThiS family protein [Pseudomonas sp. MWU15-20650]